MPKPIFWTPLYFGLEILNLSTKNIFIRFILGKYFRFILKFFFEFPALITSCVGWIGICSTTVETLARFEPMHCFSVKGDRPRVNKKTEKTKKTKKNNQKNQTVKKTD